MGIYESPRLPQAMPYPLPDDPESVTDLVWKVIAIPDDPAYSRAALDRYSGISDVWNWGLDGVEAGSYVARQSWLTAVLATLELWDMNPLETIIGLIDLVETLLEQIRDGQCCDGVVGDPIADMRTDDWATGDDVPANIVSAGFATSSSDQDGYDDYKCVVANVAVQDLIEKVTRAASYIDAGGKLVGGIAAIAALLAFVFAGPALTTLTALSLGIVGATGAAAVLFGFFSDAGKVNLEAMAADLTDAYADLVCAIYTADGNEDAKDALAAELSATVGATAAAAIRIISDMVIDALYAGRYDATNTAQALADAGFTASTFDCSGCELPQVLTTLFTTQAEDCTLSTSSWTNNPTPIEYWYTNQPKTFTDAITHGDCSSGDHIAVRFHDEDLANNPPVTPTSWRVKVVDWSASGYADAIRFYNSSWTVISTVSNGSLVLDQWYTAPAGTRAIMVLYANGYATPEIEIELLETP